MSMSTPTRRVVVGPSFPKGEELCIVMSDLLTRQQHKISVSKKTLDRDTAQASA